ncbi:MAG: glycosyltransferase family 2 protein [Prochloraceae cyanobacterium]|nr:glycosyltransferase family 2 protein [Prochloraceae cyanobacterium]
MHEKSWPENESDKELDPISNLLSELSDPEEEEEEFRRDFFKGLEGRRSKAAFVLTIVWGTTIALHLVSWGYWAALGFSGLIAIQSIRLVVARPKSSSKTLDRDCLADAPFVSLVVAAKNEEAVIGNLAKMLCDLDYPIDKYEVWIINDNSSDGTPIILNKLARECDRLNVLHRGVGATGGKSGALNQVLPLTKGEIIGVFDADAKVSADLLLQMLPLFDSEEIGAVQVRKAISNASLNFWTRGQMAEMAVDSYYQQQRYAIGGIGELRGNGQFVRRSALERCGGWNEQTITDDLDLTIRLHLDGWNIGFLQFPPVQEEGVENAKALWHQRNRWAEGGYQRYLDYWRLIVSNRMGFKKTADLLTFLTTQYILAAAAIPDCLMAIARHRLPVFAPLSTLLFTLTAWGMFSGLRRIRNREKFKISDWLIISLQTVRGFIYMLHWLVVMASTTARMSVRPKRLKWVKTVHQGHIQTDRYNHNELTND